MKISFKEPSNPSIKIRHCYGSSSKINLIVFYKDNPVGVIWTLSKRDGAKEYVGWVDLRIHKKFSPNRLSSAVRPVTADSLEQAKVKVRGKIRLEIKRALETTSWCSNE